MIRKMLATTTAATILALVGAIPASAATSYEADLCTSSGDK